MLNRIIERLRSLFSRQAKAALDIAEDAIEDAIEDAVEDLTDLANKTKAELVEMARDLDLSGYARLNKAELVALIETSEVL